MLVDAMGVFLPDDPDGNAKLVFSILDCLPKANRVNITLLKKPAFDAHFTAAACLQTAKCKLKIDGVGESSSGIIRFNSPQKLATFVVHRHTDVVIVNYN